MQWQHGLLDDFELMGLRFAHEIIAYRVWFCGRFGRRLRSDDCHPTQEVDDSTIECRRTQ